jgi:2-iminobutanoate/2-iminopropanoate deaminase
MPNKDAVNPDELCSPTDDYDQPWSHAVSQTGTPLHISGQTPVDEDGDVMYTGNMKKQFRRAMENLVTVVQSAGGSVRDLAAVTIYVTDMEEWLDDDVSDVRLEFFDEPYPCSTLIEVERLIDEAMTVEVEAVAYIPE